LKKTLAKRNNKMSFALRRQLRIMDDNNDGRLSWQEFNKSMKDLKVAIAEADLLQLFLALTGAKSNLLIIDQFMNKFVGQMSITRRALVEMAFESIDLDKDGRITINELKGSFSGKGHPDVRANLRSQDEVRGEFIESFEAHHSSTNSKRSIYISKEEFSDYYNNLSCMIAEDDYFEGILKSSWKLTGPNPAPSRPGRPLLTQPSLRARPTETGG
jgi:Ca2+-binding EF-hand superfamily protein